MVDEILPNIYKIEIPLRGNPLRVLNSYLIKSKERNLIIDTGLNREECLNKMLSSLKLLGVELNRTDFFITHLHVDHVGLVGNLVSSTSTKVYFNKPEAGIINSMSSVERWQRLGEIYKSHGFDEGELKEVMKGHPAYLYLRGLRRPIDFSILKDSDTLDIGEYSLRCIATPGHSPGHMCLYEINKQTLFSGDHILSEITPNISFWLEMENSLDLYLASLKKIYPLDIKLVLPGHRSILTDHRKRITELEEHHQSRLKEALSALKDGGRTAFQIAPHLTWDLDYSSWEQFPPLQKWFAIGETIAHLQYLEKKGILQTKDIQKKTVFSLV